MTTTHPKAIKGMSIANIVLAALGIFGMLIAWAGRGGGGAAAGLALRAPLMNLPQDHLRNPCYDFSLL